MVIRSNRSLRNTLRHRSAWLLPGRKRFSTPVHRLPSCNSRESHQLVPRWIDSLADDVTINKYEGQTFCADLGEHLLYNRVLRECVGVLGEIKPFNLNPLRFQPIEVRRKTGQHGIYLRAANASRTTHRGIKNLKDYHWMLSLHD